MKVSRHATSNSMLTSKTEGRKEETLCVEGDKNNPHQKHDARARISNETRKRPRRNINGGGGEGEEIRPTLVTVRVFVDGKIIGLDSDPLFAL